jgi:hypothetical protein
LAQEFHKGRKVSGNIGKSTIWFMRPVYFGRHHLFGILHLNFLNTTGCRETFDSHYFFQFTVFISQNPGKRVMSGLS